MRARATAVEGKCSCVNRGLLSSRALMTLLPLLLTHSRGALYGEASLVDVALIVVVSCSPTSMIILSGQPWKVCLISFEFEESARKARGMGEVVHTCEHVEELREIMSHLHEHKEHGFE